MYNSKIHDKLEEIKESIELIQEWSKNVVSMGHRTKRI